jgi:hypothetical protein
MDIPDPPDRPVCARCGPLKWGWFPATRQGARWVSFTIGDEGVLAPHPCGSSDAPAIRWEPDEQVAERAKLRADLIREQLGIPKKHIAEGEVRHA